MWIFLNSAMLSVVADRNSDAYLLVRGRIKGDIERVFPSANVKCTPDADYFWRALVKREEIVRAISEELTGLKYFNFKSSVQEHFRHEAYFDVWARLREVQEERQDILDL
jgi:hypothetical protein